jgi:hypothetical protein
MQSQAEEVAQAEADASVRMERCSVCAHRGAHCQGHQGTAEIRTAPKAPTAQRVSACMKSQGA